MSAEMSPASDGPVDDIDERLRSMKLIVVSCRNTSARDYLGLCPGIAKVMGQ